MLARLSIVWVAIFAAACTASPHPPRTATGPSPVTRVAAPCTAKLDVRGRTDLRIEATNKGGGYFTPACLRVPEGRRLHLTLTNRMYAGGKPLGLSGLCLFRARDLPTPVTGRPYALSCSKALARTALRGIDAGSTAALDLPPLERGRYAVISLTLYPKAMTTLIVR